MNLNSHIKLLSTNTMSLVIEIFSLKEIEANEVAIEEITTTQEIEIEGRTIATAVVKIVVIEVVIMIKITKKKAKAEVADLQVKNTEKVKIKVRIQERANLRLIPDPLKKEQK